MALRDQFVECEFLIKWSEEEQEQRRIVYGKSFFQAPTPLTFLEINARYLQMNHEPYLGALWNSETQVTDTREENSELKIRVMGVWNDTQIISSKKLGRKKVSESSGSRHSTACHPTKKSFLSKVLNYHVHHLFLPKNLTWQCVAFMTNLEKPLWNHVFFGGLISLCLICTSFWLLLFIFLALIKHQGHIWIIEFDRWQGIQDLID